MLASMSDNRDQTGRPTSSPATHRVWWVNQSSRKGAADNETVWAPKESQNGRVPAHWASLLQVQPGDVIYHYTDTYLVGVSRAVSASITATNPYVDGPENWEELGNRVPVDYSPFDSPVHRDAIPLEVRINNVGQHVGPFDRRGQVAQGYLYPVSAELFHVIARMTGFEFTTGVSGRDLDTIDGPTDAMAQSLVRREQPILRMRLLDGRSIAPCGLCGQDTPADYLVAGHIKKRSEATERERRDQNVAMLVCLFGCDRAFEIGDALVGSDGRITISQRLREARPGLARQLEATQARAYNSQTAPYFRHRFEALRSAHQ